MKHEWKAGDKALVEIESVDKDGTIWVEDFDSRSPDPIRAACIRPVPDHSAYIGRLASGVPEDTLAVITDSRDGSLDVAIKSGGEWVYATSPGNPSPKLGTPDPDAEVYHIIKLGEPKPLADVAERVIEGLRGFKDKLDRGEQIIARDIHGNETVLFPREEQQPSA